MTIRLGIEMENQPHSMNVGVATGGSVMPSIWTTVPYDERKCSYIYDVSPATSQKERFCRTVWSM